MCPHLSANYVLGCPSNMAQVSVWAGNLHYDDRDECSIPKYVDMTDYLGCFELDLDDLIVDLYKTRE